MVQEKEGWQGDNTGALCPVRQKTTKSMCGEKEEQKKREGELEREMARR
jgi:hypothetical protein